MHSPAYGMIPCRPRLHAAACLPVYLAEQRRSPNESAFAGAVRSEDADPFARRHRKGKIMKNLQSSRIREPEVFNFQRGGKGKMYGVTSDALSEDIVSVALSGGAAAAVARSVDGLPCFPRDERHES